MGRRSDRAEDRGARRRRSGGQARREREPGTDGAGRRREGGSPPRARAPVRGACLRPRAQPRPRRSARPLAATDGLSNADRQGTDEPRELAGSKVLDKLARRVAPASVKRRIAEREAEQEQREQAWREEQAARLKEQREKLAAGELVRCACC